MELEESLQRNIMQAIQELETTFSGSMASSISNFDLKTLQEDRDRLAQSKHEADRQIALLIEEKALLLQEVNRLQQEVESFEQPRSGLIGDDAQSLGPVAPGSQRFTELRRQLDTLKEDLLQAEAQRDDFKIKSIQLEEELVVMKMKQDETNVSNK